MRTAVRMEWFKLTSLRSTWWLLAATVASMAAAGLGVGLGYRAHTPRATSAQIINNTFGGAVLAQLFVGALGVLLISSEYSSGTIRTTFAAMPRRGRVLAAKALVYGGTALAAGLLASAAGLIASQLAISGSPIATASPGEFLPPLLMTSVYLGMIGLLGLGLGALTRHSGGAIGALFGGLFVPLVLAGLLGPGALPVTRFLPLLMLINSISVTTPVPGMLPAAVATLVLAGYAALGVGLASVLLTHRDA
jgi:ABC-2 type transport system permease protein